LAGYCFDGRIALHLSDRMKVQHWLDDVDDVSEDDYKGITCQACASVHFVNRKGKVLGGDDE
jgi:hypothetical protein